MDLRGKNVVYVGGFGGIGFAACKILISKNIANLVILDVQECSDLLNELKSLNESVEVHFIKLDLCNKESITQSLKETVDRITFIDVLVNGSGVVSETNVERAVTINLTGLINTTLTAIPYMDKSLGGRGGVILNVSSLLGLEPAPPTAVYSATKYGIVGFTRSIAHDYYYQRTGIMMMVLCPGLTITPLLTSYDHTQLTFSYSSEVMSSIMTTKSQTAEECAVTLVKALECARNGAVWKSEAGQLDEIQMHKYWEVNN